jgi:hypothetical protein
MERFECPFMDTQFCYLRKLAVSMGLIDEPRRKKKAKKDARDLDHHTSTVTRE